MCVCVCVRVHASTSTPFYYTEECPKCAQICIKECTMCAYLQQRKYPSNLLSSSTGAILSLQFPSALRDYLTDQK